MKVTEKTLQRLELAAFECQSGLAGSREAFETALADVPDPSEAHYEAWFQFENRALEAEAKLARVREWAQFQGGHDIDWIGLDAILDGD